MIAQMAGRGVDIKLGGDPEHHAITSEDAGDHRESEGYNEAGGEGTVEMAPQCKAEDEEVASSAALICATSATIAPHDNQLRGRAAATGDHGESRFFISAEDD